MKSLFERLKTTHKVELLNRVTQFPYSLNAIIAELKRVNFYTELTYDTVLALVSHLNLKGCDPNYISDIFESR